MSQAAGVYSKEENTMNKSCVLVSTESNLHIKITVSQQPLTEILLLQLSIHSVRSIFSLYRKQYDAFRRPLSNQNLYLFLKDACRCFIHKKGCWCKFVLCRCSMCHYVFSDLIKTVISSIPTTSKRRKTLNKLKLKFIPTSMKQNVILLQILYIVLYKAA